MTNNRILVLGAGGMLGNAMLRVLSEDTAYEVVGAVRNPQTALKIASIFDGRINTHFNADDLDSLMHVIKIERPAVIVNCVGLIKQRAEADDPLATLPVNSLFPHRLARVASLANARVIHFSTDCVFSGKAGGYVESDFADAYDLYGRSKLLGELHESHCFTVRTSIIGHELDSSRSLIGWFLSQSGSTKGFRRAIFSGLPTVELAKIVRDYILPNPQLSGLWHVSADPINKYELLRLVADIYKKDIEIVADDDFVIDRSLNSDRFRKATGYSPPDWRQLIQSMHQFH